MPSALSGQCLCPPLAPWRVRPRCLPTLLQEPANALIKAAPHRPYFTLPNHQDLPSQSSELSEVGRVALSVATELGFPILKIRSRSVGQLAARMLMPETSVYEEHLPAPRENQVGAPRQVVSVKAVPIAHGVHKAPHRKLGLHALAADRTHIGATHFWLYPIQFASRPVSAQSGPMALQVIEFFGHAPLDPAAAGNVAERLCPFVNDDCIKPKHGACSVQQLSAPEPVICCPNRMYGDNFKILTDIAAEAFGAGSELMRPADAAARIANGSMTGSEVAVFGRYWGQELPLPRPPGAGAAGTRTYYVDWILAKLDALGSVAELTAIEVQTIDTTGNYSDQALSFFAGQAYTDPQGRSPGYSDAGMNWENVNKRILPQIIYKGHVLHREKKCTKGLFFVCPKQVHEKIQDRLGGDLNIYHPGPGSITFLSYELGSQVPAGQQRSMNQSGKFTTSVQEVALAFTSPKNLPNMNVYEAAIIKALRR